MNHGNGKTIAVIGAGVMGHSLALIFALGGYTVRLCDLKDEILESSIDLIRSTLDTLVEFGRLSQNEIPETLGRIHPTRDLPGAVQDAGFVIEAVPEVPEIKKALFGKLNALCSRDTILASNTSGLDIFNIADVDNPERLIITHWFSPAYLIPLVEVVPGG
ncbi:MAG: 3-hydroxyacyl-CoA dehydrogenase family protein, partial [Deltaproteobacteria bacterium]|nr:3-hydroxyacyl-CoA dehydrogenase family protein [Deltaproteobacteria bacterium]